MRNSTRRNRQPPGQRRAESLEAETWPKSVIAAVITGLPALLATQDQPSVPAKSRVAAIRSEDPSPTVAEQYRVELHREPGMIGALVSVASADPGARTTASTRGHYS